MSNTIRSRATLPSRYSWKSAPSNSIRLPVGGMPGGSIGPVCVAVPFHQNAARGPSLATCAPPTPSKAMSGNARQVWFRNSRTSALPRMVSGEAESS